MSLNNQSYFSANNATIIFDNNPIGFLQNITINESYNVVEVDGIGSQVTVDYLPGVFKGRITAQRGLIELNFMFDLLKPFVSDTAVITSLLQNLPNKDNSSFTGVLSQIGNIGDALNRVRSMFNPVGYNQAMNVIMFDVKIIDNNSQAELFTLVDCILDSRSTSISLGNVLVMTDITLKYRYKQPAIAF